MGKHRDINDLANDVGNYSLPPLTSNLDMLMSSSRIVRERKNGTITFPPPILTLNELPVIYPKTINVIQGQTGVHKSRLAEIITSRLITKSSQEIPLGFRSNLKQETLVIYIDTERNLTEQFPAGIQSVLRLAGYKVTDDPENFDYTSMMNIERAARFESLTEYLEHCKKKGKQLFIVLDVLSDFISDFNNVHESLRVNDLMNQLIQENDATFLCIIHENPGGNKARGHLGTELTNKASTVIQISNVSDADSGQADLVKISFLKCRSSARHQPIYAQYDSQTRTLAAVDYTENVSSSKSRDVKAPLHSVKNLLRGYLENEPKILKRELLERLGQDFGTHPNKIRDRINELIKTQEEIVGRKSGKTMIITESKIKKEVWLQLSPWQAPLNTLVR